MALRGTVRAELRAATAACHYRVDALYAQFDLTDVGGYGRFLTAQAAAHVAAEDALDRAGAAAALSDWPQRRRAALLGADLAALGLPAPACAQPPAFACPAAVLGGVYVLEGSRLGGRVLRRSVPAAFPCSFLDAGDPAGWRVLLGILEDRLGEPVARDRAIAGAKAVFALFEQSAARHLNARS